MVGKRILIGALVLLVIACVLFFGVVPGMADDRMNVVTRPTYVPVVSREMKALHASAFIVDLHADSLLWGRDLLQRNPQGHLDVPRLQEGHVALQIFDAVTKTPKNMNVDRNDASTDNISLVALAQRWPLAAQTSLLQRALHQARMLHALVERSQGKLRFVGTRAELMSLSDGVIGAMLGLEGAHALEGKVENVDVLYDAGFRLIGLAHFFDNEFSGSAHGVQKGGLGAEGERLLRRIESKRMLVDLAHASPTAVDEVLKLAKRPIVVSHTGVRATCDTPRNLSDEQLRAIAANGGLVGIGYWSKAVCGDDVRAIVRAIAHAVSILGPDHVALGSDYDGAVVVPFDVAHLDELTAQLHESGMDDNSVRKILGDNARRFLSEQLP